MDLPTFTPEEVHELDQKVELAGSVSAEIYLGQNWIGERWIGYIGRVGMPPVRGRWFSDGDRWRFITDERRSLDFHPDEPLQLYDGYWGERAYIVLAPMIWTEEQFVAKKDWDHDHCGICWGTIHSDAPKHFRGSDRDIVCPDCYERYVVTRCLEFIQPTPNKSVDGMARSPVVESTPTAPTRHL